MSNLDELLQPTVTAEPKRKLPWRVASQFWVAFFGGAPAVSAIAFLNARRLGVPARKQAWIIAAAVAAVVVTIALFVVMRLMGASSSLTRIGGRVVAVGLYLVLAHIQSEDDGRHQVFGSGEYASMWVPGILATVISAILLFAFAFSILQLGRFAQLTQ